MVLLMRMRNDVHDDADDDGDQNDGENDADVAAAADGMMDDGVEGWA